MTSPQISQLAPHPDEQAAIATVSRLPADDGEAAHSQHVAQIRRDYPRWVTIWNARAGRYRAWPLFRARRGISVSAPTPNELTAQMDQVEQDADRPRGRSAPPPR